MSLFGWKDLSNLPFCVLTLLEEVQLSWLPNHGWRRELAITLRANPDVAWFIRHKCPSLEQWLDELFDEFAHEPLPSPTELHQLEQAVIGGMEDWIVYVTEPEAYDRQQFNRWDNQELLGLTDFAGKVVLDIGAGTGSQTFRVAPHAKTVFAIEPIANLRKFLRERAQALGLDNVYVVDGLLTRIPFPNGSADILVGGHVFGDEMPEELAEMRRVVKPGGMIILCPGNNDSDGPSHQWLVGEGFAWARFLEPGAGWVRKYWMVKA